MKLRSLPLGSSIFVMALMSGTSARAQVSTVAGKPLQTESDRLDEIVVTAQRRAENLQDVPIAISALTGAALQERGIANVRDLGQAVPGLSIDVFNGIVLPFVRGVGTTSAVVAGRESSVAAYVDGVYFTRLTQSLFDLSNVDRIEVLKGPQGTLFGRNSTGGVIQIVTRDPSYDPMLMGSIGYGRFDAVAANAYVSTGLADGVAIDLAVSGKTDDGWGRNLQTGNRFAYEDNILVRSKLLIEPADDTKIVLSGFYNDSKNAYMSYPYPGTRTKTLSAPSRLITREDLGFYNASTNIDSSVKFQVWGVSGRVEQDLSFATIVSITAYTRAKEDTSGGFVDDRPTPNAINRLGGPNRQFTQEVQLLSKPGSDLSWVLGYFYFDYFTAYVRNPTLSGPLYGPGLTLLGEQKAISHAVFGQASYAVASGLSLTGGLRYTSDRNRADGSIALATSPPTVLADPPPARSTNKELTFRIGADYQIGNSALVYASFNRGYKTGAFNILPYSPVPTEPEKIDAYEIGFKTDLLDGKLRFNGAAFYYDIINPQVNLSSPTGVIFSNAGGSRVKGGELEMQALIVPGIQLRAAVSVLDSKYTDYDSAPAVRIDNVNGGTVALPPIDAKGNRTPLAPRLTLTIGGDYSFETPLGPATITADYYHNSGYVFEPDGLIREDGYDLVNAQLRQELNDRLAFRVWGRNLTSAKYAVVGGSVTGPNFGVQFGPGAPLTYGVALDFKF